MQEPDKFVARHLKPEQIKSLYAQALEQAEGAVASAWINFMLNMDSAHEAVYKLAAEKLARVENDLNRLTEAK